MSQKGNVALIILVLVALVVGGFYLFVKGKPNLVPLTPANKQADSYTLSPSSASATDPVATSDKISLSITSPAPGTILKSPSVNITGKTSPNADIFVNDVATKANASGSFSINVTLDEGENNVIVSANDEEGNVAEQNLLVTVETF